jgi:outer membrane protein assembly factor BamD (BamD/ComL family)
MFRKQISVLLLCLSLIGAGTVHAQTTEEEDRNRFTQGKKLVEEERYDLALEAFRPLMAPGNANAYAEYARYYYGLALFKKKDYANASLLMKELLEKYPNWQDRDEAIYILGLSAFERRQFPQGIETLNRIHGEELGKLSKDAKLFYLEKASLDNLKRLHEQFPRDEAVAFALAEKIYYSADRNKNQELFNKLITGFNIERFSAKAKQRQEGREYKVAVLFPFSLKTIDTQAAARNNQFVLDMYQGMQLAEQDLEKEGVNISLHAYDTERDAGRIAEIVSLPEMQGMDLLVGPVYANGAPVVTEFAAQRRVNAVNPLSTNLNLVENNPHAFLSETSPESQTKQVARYALNSFPNKRVVILYENNARDSIKADLYRKAIYTQGGTIAAFREVNRASAGSISAILKQSKLDSLGHVFVSSSDPVVATGLVAAMEVNRSRVPVIAPADWLESASSVTLEQWQRQNVHFIFPTFIYESEEVKSFRNRYAEKTNMIPSVYAFQGYEMMMYFGRALANYGRDFQEDIRREGFRRGVTMGGYDYSDATDNQFVPLVKVEDTQLKVVNEPQN